MPPKKNPLGLNALQLRTLTLLQQMATTRAHSLPADEAGKVVLGNWPSAHGDHFHIGDAVVSGADATGLHHEAVFTVLVRKGLLAEGRPGSAVLTPEGLAYDTGTGDILRRHHHH